MGEGDWAVEGKRGMENRKAEGEARGMDEGKLRKKGGGGMGEWERAERNGEGRKEDVRGEGAGGTVNGRVEGRGRGNEEVGRGRRSEGTWGKGEI
jgi:hypothetical protein